MATRPLFKTSARRRLLTLTGFASVPLYLVPLSVWGSRALWPPALRRATTGALVLGVLSLLGLSLRQLPRKKTVQPSKSKDARWQLPVYGPIMPEEFFASAASGH